MLLILNLAYQFFMKAEFNIPGDFEYFIFQDEAIKNLTSWSHSCAD